jgi:hypothetical protein
MQVHNMNPNTLVSMYAALTGTGTESLQENIMRSELTNEEPLLQDPLFIRTLI